MFQKFFYDGEFCLPSPSEISPRASQIFRFGIYLEDPTCGVTQTFFLFKNLLKLTFIEIELLYNVLVSTIQQSELAVHIHTSPVFWIS